MNLALLSSKWPPTPLPPEAARRNCRLDFNENTVGCSPKVIEYLAQRLTGSQLSIYPEYADTMRELATFFNVNQKEFILTNGTDEAIQVMINTFVDDGDEVITLKPSYAMYRFYAELAGAQVTEIGFPADLSFPLDGLLNAVTPKTKAILIANPNNPTGTGLSLDGVQKILESAPQAAVLIDEAYYEFCGVTALPWINKYKNLFVSRTFSKVYGMAAMRCGCLFSSSSNVQWMHKAQSPVQREHSGCARRPRRGSGSRVHRKTMWPRCSKPGNSVAMDWHAWASLTFQARRISCLFQAGDRAIAIRDTLRDRGVLVRDRSYEIAGCVRVTIGTRAQTERFLTELENVWKK